MHTFTCICTYILYCAVRIYTHTHLTNMRMCTHMYIHTYVQRTFPLSSHYCLSSPPLPSPPNYSHVWDTWPCNMFQVLPQQPEPFWGLHNLLQFANPLHHHFVALCNSLLQTINWREDKPIQDGHKWAVVVHSMQVLHGVEVREGRGRDALCACALQ